MIVSTVSGGLHAFVPLRDNDAASDVYFFRRLERALATLADFVGDADAEEDERKSSSIELGSLVPPTSLCHRNHASYRSYFSPSKNTIDGDLCEAFLSLSHARQQEIATTLGTPRLDIIDKIKAIRERLF